ncbi:hypothetical protein CH63R_05140 [Colletotrichum higginsianum IMI 349063]|uniref:Uncharacterized protein n=1 Tax=Colletotrichum higginsianum (strain IMI 349063) TaxID=759273 RepID=A0A1B7YLP1_COLHI|nr:hypothetical protein CH63R_05140 [Colletotrichum higginsianum IMI 349063]OBR12844.1 hypothetical protein CH63R_05140 [Colletotrichum higginsianum IMI 349063]
MLPQHRPKNKKDKPWPYPRFANIGDGEDGKFTFGQFQARIQGINWDPKRMLPEDVEKYNSLKAPWSNPDGKTPTIHEVAEQLMELGFNEQLVVAEFDPTLTKERFLEAPKKEAPKKKAKHPSLYVAADPYRSPYSYYIERVEEQFQSYRARGGRKHAAILKKNNDLGREILECIVTLRREDVMKQLYTQMQDDLDDDLRRGLEIPKNLIVARLGEPSLVPGGKPYPKLYIDQTMDNAWNDAATRERLEAKGFKSVDQLVDWAKKLGNPAETLPQRWTKSNLSHFRAAKTWRWALAKSRSSVDEKRHLGDDSEERAFGHVRRGRNYGIRARRAPCVSACA